MKYQVVNPATGQVEREYPTATDAEIGEILARAERGYLSWRRTPMTERADVLRRVARLYQDRSAELGAIITREMGKTIAEALGEVELTVAIYLYYADHGPDLLKDEPLQSNTPGSAWVRRSPIGALLGIMPWNYPYYQVARFAAPNLIIGNTIVLKHAPQCPESALAMEQIFGDAGLPADAYINVFASNEQAAEMIADRRIAGVSVTGSDRAGAAVAATAGQYLKKVVLELGGSDAFIVLDGADLPSVAKAAAAARMQNGGQACSSSKRMIVTDDVYDEFMAEFTTAMSGYTTGDPNDPATVYGPLSSEQAARTIMDQINDAVSKGATVNLGGHRLDRPGAYVEATVLSGVTPEMRAYHEELFGPANSSAYGLGSAVFASDESVALDVADRLDVGMVWINQREGGGPELPFGGTKRSGIGRELGPLGIDEFVNKKLMHTTPDAK
jgi:succinate-semialdehyde dehydrogenase / glutarate-semialdehyde dehydrogenase